MRYYDLTLINPQGQILAVTSNGFEPSTTGQPTFSSRVRRGDGQLINNPGALNIEFDIPTAGFALPQGNAWIRVWGVGIKTIAQASNLNSDPATGRAAATFILSGGWIKGLPLANDYVSRRLSGIIAQGQVLYGYGNWQGTEQCLEMLLIPADLDPPNGISFIWAPGQELSDAIANSLAVAFPDLQQSVTMLSGMTQQKSSKNIVDWVPSLTQFSDYIFKQSRELGQSLLGNKYYQGAVIAFRGDTVYATDSTLDPKTVQIAFIDLVDQPTWIAPNEISFKCVLRADAQVGDMVMMPLDPGTGGTSIISALALTQPGAAVPGAPARNSSTFKGSFIVNEVHHWGNLRQADANSWATGFTAVAPGPTGSS